MVDPYRFVLDPEWVAAVAIALVDYMLVARAFGRGGAPVPWYRWAAFLGGLGLIAVALFSPVEHLALTSMVSFHLLQNVIIADWAPPLLLAGLTPRMLRAAERSPVLRAFTCPGIAMVYWLLVWYVAHTPAVYGYALEHRWALGIEHLAFVTAGLAFWWPVLSPGRMQPMPKLVYLVAAFFLAAPVSLLLALSGSPAYDFYLHTPKLWGWSALQDQQVGAITMAVEQAAILFAASSVVFMRMLEDG